MSSSILHAAGSVAKAPGRLVNQLSSDPEKVFLSFFLDLVRN